MEPRHVEGGLETTSIAVLPGDGIGPEVVAATLEVLGGAARRRGVELTFSELPAGLGALEPFGSTMPRETLDNLSRYSGWILGPVSHHLYPIDDSRYISPSGYLRKTFDLYGNLRPARSFAGVGGVQENVDLLIARENTEGFYADRNVLDGNGEFRPDENMVISVRVVTKHASTRIAELAYAHARRRRRRLTVVHKANVLRRGDGLFLDCVRTVGQRYSDVELEDMHVDAFATRLVEDPSHFDVAVTTNMFGDILSGCAAGLVGGLGLAPSLNEGEKHAMAQAVHGSAPELAGRGVANPIAVILSATLLLEWLGERGNDPRLGLVAHDVESAVAELLAAKQIRTRDLGGTSKTDEVTAELGRIIGSQNVAASGGTRQVSAGINEVQS